MLGALANEAWSVHLQWTANAILHKSQRRVATTVRTDKQTVIRHFLDAAANCHLHTLRLTKCMCDVDRCSSCTPR
jgi:hypothetical protein